jgi:DNA-binding response OmpR family regulator
MSTARILLAEDSRSIAQHMGRILAAHGCADTAAEDGRAAWDIINGGEAAFEVIVLDREMPRMNGIELLRRIKAAPQFSQLPVVMATGVSDEASVLEGLAAGAYYYLTKPFVPEVLVSVVEAALGQYREYRKLRDSVRQAERPFAFLESGTFRFRTLDDGRLLANSLARACPDPEKAVLGLQEIIVNAVEHGNLAIGYEEKSALLMSGQWLDEVSRRLDSPAHRNKHVTVRFERKAEAITISVIDEGNGFDWRKYVDFSAECAFDNHGRGIAMARTFSFDAIEYLGNGNTVVVTATR